MASHWRRLETSRHVFTLRGCFLWGVLCLVFDGAAICALHLSHTRPALALLSPPPLQAAEEALLLVQNEKYKAEYCYISWLARCYIHNGQPRNAWELYLKMETSNESFNLLQLIANDCYRMGHFLYAAKAFDVLERLDPDPEYWEGKRGACVGVFQQVVAGRQQRSDLQDVLAMVRNTSNPQVLASPHRGDQDSNSTLVCHPPTHAFSPSGPLILRWSTWCASSRNGAMKTM